MKVYSPIKNLLALATLVLGLTLSNLGWAETFEEAGLIDKVDLVRHTISVNDEQYILPPAVKVGRSNRIAIITVKEGMTVRFYGEVGSTPGTSVIKGLEILALPESDN